jgi:hypothetical protein
MHYPGEVTQSDGTTSPITCWDNHALAPNATYVTVKGVVWSDFWVSFLVILFQSFIPEAADFATTWFWNCKNNSTCTVKTCRTTWGVCSRRVLTSSLLNPYQMDGFTHPMSTCRRSRGSSWLIPQWFRYVSNWECRGTGGPPGHTYGPDGHICMGQRMVRKIVTKMHSHFVFSY